MKPVIEHIKLVIFTPGVVLLCGFACVAMVLLVWQSSRSGCVRHAGTWARSPGAYLFLGRADGTGAGA